MSFESVYRSKQGVREIEKISNFIGSLVIKNEYEAQRDETTESLSEYIKYHGAYTNTDSFNSYSLEERRDYKSYVWTYMNNIFKTYTFNSSILNTITESRIQSLQAQYDNGVPVTRDYLKALRAARLEYYDEKNNYYRQFLGKPNNSEDIVYVINKDIDDEGYTEITDLTEPPDPKQNYYTKIIDEDNDGTVRFVALGKIVAWYKIDQDTGEVVKIADNFYRINTIPIDKIDKISTPLTYNYFILQQHISEVIEEYPTKYYLRFIDKTFTPFYLRSLPNYSIIWYDQQYLSTTEMYYFFKSYDKARRQVVLDYIKGFDSKQPLYNLLMIQNLLYYTILNYSATYIEKYSVGIYTEENCNDILNSKGYSSLTKISNLELKQRIVRNLSELISNKGNNYILEIIMNKILINPNSELKRYYLEKQYTVDNTSAISINTSKGLENSIDLIFREVPALSINELSSSTDKYHEYDAFVNSDNLWGGLETSDTSQARENKKMVLKRKLMSLPFNSILTKYITLTQSVDILESQRELRDAVYLMLKYFDEHEYTPFFKEKITFGGISVTPSALFAGMCWLQQMKYYSDPDKIIYDNCVINSSVVFRNMGTTSVDVNNLENKTFIIDGKPVVIYNISPEIASWKVVDFIKENIEDFEDFMTDIGIDGERIETCRITDQYYDNGTIREKGILRYEMLYADGNKYLNDSMETIEDDLVRFRFFSEGRDLGDFTSSTTFEELITDYKNQYPNLIERINKKLKESYDYREYQAWSYLLKLNRTDNSIDFIFKGFDTFSSYMNYTESNGLVEYILNTIPKMDNDKYNIDTIVNVQNQLSSAFKTWVNDTFSTLVYQSNTGSEESSSGDVESSFVDDMKLLFDEFLSVFTQLYSVDYSYSFGDKELNGLNLQLFYNPLNQHYSDNYQDKIGLSYTDSSRAKTEFDDELKLWDTYSSYEFGSFEQNINGDLLISEKGYIYADDQFKYEESRKYYDKFYDNLNLRYNLAFKCKTVSNDNIGLNYSLLNVRVS